MTGYVVTFAIAGAFAAPLAALDSLPRTQWQPPTRADVRRAVLVVAAFGVVLAAWWLGRQELFLLGLGIVP